MFDVLTRESQPRYRILADVLIEEIVSGKLDTGQTLPSEHELVERFRVSRYTVREALRVLQDSGMITRRQGKGTMVTGRFPTRAYTQVHQSFPKLLQYPKATHFHLESTRRITVDEISAARLQCDIGTEWMLMKGIRHFPNNGGPFCWTEIYLDPDYDWLAGMLVNHGEPIDWSLLRKLDECIYQVRVNLTARQMSADMAHKLEREAGTTSFSVTRSLLTNTGHVFEIDISEHPEGNFSYSVDFQREWLGS